MVSFLSAYPSHSAYPLRIQWFHLRMMRFSYSISYISVTNLCTADALSRFPLRDVSRIMPDIDTFVTATVAAVPIRNAIVDDIRAATTDNTLQQVLRYCQAGWPDVKNLSPDVLQFAH